LTPDVVQSWEAATGPIAHDEIVILKFGCHRKIRIAPADTAFITDWPGLHRDLADYLLDRRIRAIGTDCLSIDCSGSTEIPAHDRFLRNGILIMENLAALEGLPLRIFLIAAPLKIRNGSGSPIRALALLPKGGEKP
jgi:kynurenine formamidase